MSSPRSDWCDASAPIRSLIAIAVLSFAGWSCGGDGSDSASRFDTGVRTDAGTDIVENDTRKDSPVCGDGVVESGEECDDGNGDETDGCSSSCESIPIPVAVAEGGQAALDLVVAPGASEAVRNHAETLQTQLERITGGEFAIVEGDGTEGIAIGVAGEFSEPTLPDLTVSSPFDREDYLLRTHPEGIHAVGATELAVRHAVWDLLHRAGYRQYFPGDAWEIVPERPDLELAFDELESPAFKWRRLGFSYGSWKDNERRLEDWKRKNRANGAFPLRSGHVWGAIIRANRETFENHPEYLGEDEEGNPTKKFCVTHPEVQQMAIDWAIQWLEDRPEEDSVSMDPSDGGGWEGCPQDEKQLGSPSNRAVFLANTVAEAINNHFDEPKFVGMYAYNQHQWAPSIEIHDRVIPSVTTAFLKQGNTAGELFDSWSDAGAQRLGLYDYYNVVVWSDDLPGEQRASSPRYVDESLRRYYAAGARFFNMETSDSWGPTGLGHWLAVRLAWELDEQPRAELREDLVDEFLALAFRGAKEPMAEFYALLDRDHELFMSEHLVGRMYRILDDALGKAGREDVRRRIRHLILYTHYVELLRDYKYAEPGDRQKRLEDVIRFAYRIHDTHMVHSLARYRLLGRDDKHADIPKGAEWNVEESNNPWKSSKSFSKQKIRAFLRDGVADHQLREFEPREYSRDLVPAEPLDLDMSKEGRIRASAGRNDDLEGAALNEAFDSFYRARSLRDGGILALYTWVPREVSTPFEIEVAVSAENIHGAESGGDLPVEFFSLTGSSPEQIGSAAFPVDKSPHRRRLEAPKSGLYRLDFDGIDRFFDIRLRNDSPELRQTYEMSPDQWVQAIGRGSYIFYVPEGTKTIGGYGTPGADYGDFIETPDGSVALDFENLERPSYFSVEVPEGADGKLWRLDELPARKRFLMTVPPQVADAPEELLLPKEVVEADAGE